MDRYIKSALRPAEDHASGNDRRQLHMQYDNLFKGIITGGWSDDSDGNVESPTGHFALITIEYNECGEIWEGFGNEDYLTEAQLLWMWPGQLAGYYLAVEDSNGIILVTAYDHADEAEAEFARMTTQYQDWDEETNGDDGH